MANKVTPRGRAASAPVGEQAANAPSLRETVASASPNEAVEQASTDPRAAKFYVRNVRHIPVSLRLKNSSNRRIELAPRGNRDDLSPVSEDELYDSILLQNVGLIIEVISATDAREIIMKQFNNAAPGSGPDARALLDMITTEDGKKVTGVTMQPSNVEGAITVGRIDETGATNTASQGEQITRVERNERMLNPTQRESRVPGSTAYPIPLVPESIPPEQAADWLAAQDPHTYVQALRAHALRNREQD